MLQVILAVAALGAVAARPRSMTAALAAASAALVTASVDGAETLRIAAAAVAPLVFVLTAGLAAAWGAERLGFTRRVASALAAASGESCWRLFVLVCGLCALLTALVSLDGAVVLLAPTLVVLARANRAPLRALLSATIAVANAFSFGLPEANPTNLVVIERLGVSPGALVEKALPAAVVAAIVAAGAVAVCERRSLRRRLLPACDRAVATAVLDPRALVAVPLRVSLQVGALVALLLPFRVWSAGLLVGRGLGSLVLVALAVGALAAAANNLVATAVVAAIALPAAVAYAALAALAAGAVATAHGSVATILATELGATEQRPLRHLRMWAPIALASTLAAVIVLWLPGA